MGDVPAPQRYPAPHEQLLQLALDARREGLSFDAFWKRAVRPGQPPVRVNSLAPPAGAVLWPRDTTDRKVAYAAISESREAWRRAYDREHPTAGEAALALLSPLLERARELARERNRDSGTLAAA